MSSFGALGTLEEIEYWGCWLGFGFGCRCRWGWVGVPRCSFRLFRRRGKLRLVGILGLGLLLGWELG